MMMTGNDLLKSQVLSHWRNIDQVTEMLLFPLAECPSITAAMEHLSGLLLPICQMFYSACVLKGGTGHLRGKYLTVLLFPERLPVHCEAG